jgi:hypothetical protein
MRRAAICVCVFILSSVLPAASLAEEEVKHRRVLGLAGDLGFGGVGGKAYTTVQTGIDVREGSLSLGLFGRVRILMQEDTDGSGVVRDRDWDEVSDYVHILRYLRYQRTFQNRSLGPIHLQAQAGEILGYTLGHGTLVRDYSNVADPDHLHAGIHLGLSGERWSFGAMVDNFIDPAVIASRFTLKPVKAATRLTIGTSFVIDPRAPLTIIVDGQSRVRRTDSAYNLQAENEPLALWGVDLGYELGGRERGRLTPYLDLNTSMLGGFGFHAGALGEVPLGKTSARLLGHAEYRAGVGAYSPTHVGTFYDVERYQASLSWSGPPRDVELDDRSAKLAAVVREAYSGQGVVAQTGVQVPRWVNLKLGVSYRPGPDAVSLWWRATTSPIPRLRLGALMLMRGLGGSYPGTSGLMAMAEGRYRVTDNIYAMAQYTRVWALSAATRYYEILQAFNISIGASWSG